MSNEEYSVPRLVGQANQCVRDSIRDGNFYPELWMLNGNGLIMRVNLASIPLDEQFAAIMALVRQNDPMELVWTLQRSMECPSHGLHEFVYLHWEGRSSNLSLQVRVWTAELVDGNLKGWEEMRERFPIEKSLLGRLRGSVQVN